MKKRGSIIHTGSITKCSKIVLEEMIDQPGMHGPISEADKQKEVKFPKKHTYAGKMHRSAKILKSIFA